MNYLDRLVSEINAGIVEKPPKDGISVADLVAKTGLSYCRCSEILRERTRKGELRKVTTRQGGTLVGYWVAAK